MLSISPQYFFSYDIFFFGQVVMIFLLPKVINF